MSDVSHTGITVRDLDRSVWFYTELLGLNIQKRYSSNIDMARPMWKNPALTALENVVVENARGQQPFQLTQASGAFDQRREHLTSQPWDLGAAHFSVVIDDLGDLVRRLADSGFILRSGGLVESTASGPSQGMRAAWVCDPDGFDIQLVASRDPFADSQAEHSGIVVSDLDRSLWFYRDMLGLEVLARGEEDTAFLAALWAAPGLEAAESVLLKKPDLDQRVLLTRVVGLEQQQLVSKQWDVGFAHVCLAVDELDVFAEQVATRGIEPRAILRGPISAWAIGSHFPDPDGFDLELLELNK